MLTLQTFLTLFVNWYYFHIIFYIFFIHITMYFCSRVFWVVFVFTVLSIFCVLIDYTSRVGTMYNPAIGIIKTYFFSVDFVTSQLGRKMIYFNGYTYSYNRRQTWICSKKRARCKARITVNDNYEIVKLPNFHNHAPTGKPKWHFLSFWFVWFILYAIFFCN